jgi:kynurenine formamidase
MASRIDLKLEWGIAMHRHVGFDIGTLALAIVGSVVGCGRAPETQIAVPADATVVVSGEETDADGSAHGEGEHAAGLLELVEDARLVDLTHPFDRETVYWPTGETFNLRSDFAGRTERGYYYTSNTFTAAEHGGTHTDAPIHFFEDRLTVDQLPLTNLIGPAVVVDLRQACADDRDYQITVDDLRQWETRHERTLGAAIVLLRTGYATHWPDLEQYLGTAERGQEAVAQLHFPGLAPEAARWLVEQRHVRAVGIDTASIDHGQSQDFGSHVVLCEHNTPILENVALTDDLLPHGFLLIALPIKIGGGSGGPTRIVAVLPGS